MNTTAMLGVARKYDMKAGRPDLKLTLSLVVMALLTLVTGVTGSMHWAVKIDWR
jgi:hypothetical protein